MKPYFFYKGLEELSEILKGTEKIYLGIRPYGFHAGNKLTLVVYPFLLCELMKKKCKVPAFEFFLFINDYEQDRLDGPDPKTYPFNIYPQQTTFQYTKDPESCCQSIVDHWQPIIEREIALLVHSFPGVKITPIRNSQMKNNKSFKRILLKTLSEPQIIRDIIKMHSNKSILDSPISFARPICPYCKSARTQTSHCLNDTINFYCEICNVNQSIKYGDGDYWFYHKILALPRIDICKINLCITGADHYGEGDFMIRQGLLEKFSPKTKLPLTLYTPVVTSEGKPMGKSKGNYRTETFQKLYKLAKENTETNNLILE